MKRLSISDIGEPGTARFHRVMVLGLSQAELAETCDPPLTQADISNFERASVRLTRKKARRLARGLYPRQCARDLHESEQRVYALWMRTVSTRGDALMKRFAQRLRERLAVLGWSLPLWKAGPPQPPNPVHRIECPRAARQA